MDLVKGINDFYYRMALCELRMMNGGDSFEGLSYNSILYVNVIALTEQCTASKLAEALGITKSAVTLKVNELARQGVIVRTQSEEDKRVYYLSLSPAMEKACGLYDEVFGEINVKLKEHYSEEELNLFGKILSTISEFDWRQIQNG